MPPSDILQSAHSASPWTVMRDGLRSLPGIPEPDDDLRQTGKVADTTDSADSDEQMGYKQSGIWTLLGLYAILAFFASRGHGFEHAWMLIKSFFIGDIAAIRSIGDTLNILLPTAAAIVVIELPLVVVIGIALKNLYGESKSHSLLKAFSGNKRHYMMMTLTVVAEELLARGLFLGLPLLLTGGQLPTFAIYALFILGNGIWALIHLGNFKNRSERQLLKVLPQFIGGFALTAVFLNFGLVGSIVVHLAFNNLLMSVYRKGTFNQDEIAVIIWRSALLVGSTCVLWFSYGKSLFDLSYWFYGDNFAVPGWQWQHYLLAVLAITSALTILGDLLLLDVLPEAVKAMEQIGYIVIITALSFGIFFGLGLLGVAIDIQVLAMALVFLLVRRSGSANGMTRVFWIGLPSLMAVLCAILALGPQSLAWMVVLVVTLAELPDRYFRFRNAANDGYTV